MLSKATHQGKFGPFMFPTGEQWFSLARDAVIRSSEHPYETFVALILSYASVEAHLEDRVQTIRFLNRPEHPKEVKTFAHLLNLLEKKRASLWTKLEVAHLTLTGQTLMKGEGVYQEFRNLEKIRHRLIHKKSEYVKFDADGNFVIPDFMRPLEARGLIQPPPPTTAAQSGLQYLASQKVARWAFEIALEMANLIDGWFPKSESVQKAIWPPIRSVDEWFPDAD